MGEDMFKDLALSRELMRDYYSKNLDDDLAQKLTVMVLQRSAWPFGAQKHAGALPEDVCHLHFIYAICCLAWIFPLVDAGAG